MAKILVGENGSITFKCPGCKDFHMISTPRWTFNGDIEKPTFSPSVLRRSGHYLEGKENDCCWCDYNKEHPEKATFKCGICHSFVTDGKIQFLSDCTHELAGQTVELEDF